MRLEFATRSRLAQQRQQSMSRLLEGCNHSLLHRAKHSNTFFTQFIYLNGAINIYHSFLMSVLTYSRCREVKIQKQMEVSSFHLRRTENSHLKYTKLQQYERGNTDINTFGIAAPDGKVH